MALRAAMTRAVAALTALVLLAAAPGAALAATTVSSSSCELRARGGLGFGRRVAGDRERHRAPSTQPAVPITPNGSTNPLSGGVTPVSPDADPHHDHHHPGYHQRDGADQRQQLAGGRQHAGHRDRGCGRPGRDRLLHLARRPPPGPRSPLRRPGRHRAPCGLQDPAQAAQAQHRRAQATQARQGPLTPAARARRRRPSARAAGGLEHPQVAPGLHELALDGAHGHVGLRGHL